jgi:hypothetical protein
VIKYRYNKSVFKHNFPAKKRYFYMTKNHLVKTILKLHVFLAILSVISFSCQKEISGEIISKSSVGSLQKDGAGNCLASAVFGTYKKDAVLDATNYVNVNVKVDSTGSFNITTDVVNGYSFKVAGNFSSTGVQTVKLTASGKPIASGTNVFTVKYNGTVCQFSVTVTAPTGGSSAYSIDCASAVLNGTYENGTSMTSANTVVLNVNVTAIGSWSLSTTAVNGITFNGSGNFTTTGAQTITLTGSGIPTASGAVNVTVNNGTSSCSFPLTINVAAVVDWKFTEGANTYQGTMTSSQLQAIGPISALTYSGSNSTDALVFGLADLAGGINANETYSSTNISGNSCGFVFSSSNSSEMYSADNTTTTVNIVFKVTSHNTSTKVIQGTFSGTVLNSSNVIKTITNGQFKATYQ